VSEASSVANLAGLRILHLEDNPEDAELVHRSLRRAGLTFEARRVERRLDFESAIQDEWDLILADYSLPDFDGALALTIAQASKPAVPFIFVSGAMGEEIAVQALKGGATDYVLKDRLQRLPLAVSRAVEEAREHQAHLRIQEQLHLWAKVFECSREAMFITDAENRIIEINRAFSEITGYSADDVLGKDPRVLGLGTHGPEFIRGMWHALQMAGMWQGEIWNRRKTGEAYPAWLSIAGVPAADRSGGRWIAAFSDITDRKRTEARIEHLAHHDSLTDLPNRALFHQLLSSAIEHARRAGEVLAVLFIDLDRFKTINDSLGHKVGDKLLCEASQRMLHSVRRADTVSRYSGDEFLILLRDIGSPEHAGRVADVVLTALRQPFMIEGIELRISATVGVGLFPENGETGEAIIRCADAAMYEAKESGRNAFRFFSRALDERSRDILELENRLRLGLERREFVLHFHPQMHPATGKVTGVEALIRWRTSDDTLLLPESFIEIAEATGLIIPIGNWVILEACMQHKRWRELGLPSVPLAVNVSPLQFRHGDLIAAISEALAKSGAEAGAMELELTESIFMKQDEALSRTLAELNRMGISMTLDDFGVGYASLHYLRRLPIAKLKVDRSFITDINTNRTSLAIVDAIIQLGQSLNMKVVAEGVENEEVLSLLIDRGCDGVQGFHFCQPMESDVFARWYSERAGTA
jgi:diguanylate cyclase (GGDEF)-like protein/PAS domain S-box-containing protein